MKDPKKVYPVADRSKHSKPSTHQELAHKLAPLHRPKPTLIPSMQGPCAAHRTWQHLHWQIG